jgi:hypothetical protein
MTPKLRTALAGLALAAASVAFTIAIAEEAKMIPVETLKKMIASDKPETKVAKVDQDRLVVHRVDVVDDDGTIRMTLAAPTPAPIIDGLQYKRAFPVAGMTVYDKNGNERGGIGVGDIDGGGAAITAEDHVNGDAVGWRVMPDGSIMFAMNERSPVRREPALDNHIVPGVGGATRVRMNVAADGTPSIALADKQDRPRVQITVTPEGFGAIEFLDANGKVVETLAPEADKRKAYR